MRKYVFFHDCVKIRAIIHDTIALPAPPHFVPHPLRKHHSNHFAFLPSYHRLITRPSKHKQFMRRSRRERGNARSGIAQLLPQRNYFVSGKGKYWRRDDMVDRTVEVAIPTFSAVFAHPTIPLAQPIHFGLRRWTPNPAATKHVTGGLHAW